MNTINLNIPLDTVNAALVALSKFPYDQAQPHIDLIRAQAEPQAKAIADDEQAKKEISFGGTD